MTDTQFPDPLLTGKYGHIYSALVEDGIVRVPEDDIHVDNFRMALYRVAKRRGWQVRTSLSPDGYLYAEIRNHEKTIERRAARERVIAQEGD